MRESKEAFDESNRLGCAKLLLRSGAKINIKDRQTGSALQHQMAELDSCTRSEICLLLYAAGETLDGATDAEKLPDCLRFEALRLNLKHQRNDQETSAGVGSAHTSFWENPKTWNTH